MDHSGELRFSPARSRYFCLASVCTWNPVNFATAYYSLKHELVTKDTAGDWDHHRFHASEDKPAVREAFVNLIATSADLRADAVTVRKNRIFQSYQPIHLFYPHMTNLLLKFVVPREIEGEVPDRIELVIDQFPLGIDPQTFSQKMLVQLRKVCGQIPHRMRLHYSFAHPHLQAADYVAWAVYRRYERGDWVPRIRIGSVLRSDWEYATGSSYQAY